MERTILLYIYASPDAELPVVEEQPPTVTPLTTTTGKLVTPRNEENVTTKRTPPQPENGCALSYDKYYTAGDPDEGYRFGKNYVTHCLNFHFGKLNAL